MGKSDETRQLIADTAVESFKERGYEQTTLRLIATEAGLSVGNTYYYFPTKTHLVQELYLRVQRDHAALADPLLEARTDIGGRLEGVLMTGLDVLSPFHESAPGFLSAMIAPSSGVNPLSSESAEARAVILDLFRRMVEGSSTPIPAFLRGLLPELLWFGYLGLALFFVYDTSSGHRKSRNLVRRSVGLFTTLLPLARLPLIRGPLVEALEIFREARS